MTRQTAIDSIIDKLNNVKPTEFCSIETIKEWCVQAKEIEKQDIMDAWKLGNLSTYLGKSTTSENYYNNNFKKE